VLQNPSNRDQTCTVARSFGIVGTEDVTDVIVSCLPYEKPADVRVFVTSATFGADLGGVTGADAKCQAAADAAGLVGRTWTAWISDSTGDAIDRIPNGRYRLLDDTLVALDKDDLVTPNGLFPPVDPQDQIFLRNGININELGEIVVSQDAWTGTETTGRARPQETCSDWTDNQSGLGLVGINDQTGLEWTAFGSPPCDLAQNALYCFGVPAPVDPCACDLNNDGACDWVDLLEFFSDWGRTDCNEPEVEPCECDLNTDGVCDNLDFSIFEEDWGRTDCPVE
jgi:hypothetical protein